MKHRISAWIVLGVITVVAGLGLAFVYEMTKEPIKQQALIKEENAKHRVMPGAALFEEIVLDNGSVLYAAKDEAGEILGYIGKSVSKGYGGPVEVITGVQADGTLTGISVGGSDFSETPGLGAKALEAAFTSQFAGKTSPVRLGDSKNPNEIDAITAATRTSNAVLAAVNTVAKEIYLYLNPDAGKNVIVEGTPYAGEAQGFGGPVAVVVTVKDDGTISGLQVVQDERFAETEGYGAQALEADFGSRFVGKTFPLTLENVDGISGATITTKAVIEAANKAYEGKNIVLPEGITYQGEARGFASPVAVTVSVKEDGTITALKIGDDRFAETEGFGAAALEPGFAAQFVGKTVPLTLADIDALSGASLTSKAVVDAINNAVESGNVVGENTVSVPVVVEPTPEPDVTAVKEPAKVDASGAVTVTKPGFMGDITVNVVFNADRSLASLSISPDGFVETEGYGKLALTEEYLEQFVGKVPPLRIRQANEQQGPDTVEKISNIDTQTSATVTTQSIVDAINEASQLPQ